MIEYQYIAETPAGDRFLSWPLGSNSETRLTNYQAIAREKFGNRTTVRVEQREVSEWQPIPAELEQEALFK